jgi:hypothetical protein
MEDSARRATANKRLHVHQRVSGAVGEYIQGPTKCHHHQRLFGHIISAVGEKKYLVRFNDGNEKECSSALLRVEKSHASLPPDVPVHMPENIQHRVDVADVEEEVADQEDEEPFAASPEDEEMEAALKMQMAWMIIHRMQPQRMESHQMECLGSFLLKVISL